MTEKRHQELLHMHRFYTEEARHQRTMMWDTVKWFTPILTLIGGGWVKYYLDNYLPCKNFLTFILLLVFAIFALSLCYFCILLLRSFYKTNIKYITMFSKVEEELTFDKRESGNMEYFPGDKFITWEGYRLRRKGDEVKNNDTKEKQYTSIKHLKKEISDKYLPFKSASIFALMKTVFYIFCLFFIFCSVFLFVSR